MADISQITLLNGDTYNLKDASARESIPNKIDVSEKGASGGVAELNNSGQVPVSQLPSMTGASSSANGAKGLVPAPTSNDVDKFLSGDGTYKSGGLPMVILSYGISTWNDFINAYKNNVIVYCRASSNANPASGSQTRMAFMAYVSNATSPTNVEFQYYRSMSAHSSTAMGDEVYVYKLTNANGGTWSVTTRKASIKEIDVASGSKLGVSWSSDKVTLSNTMTANDMPMSSSDATTAKSAIDTLNSNLTTLGTYVIIDANITADKTINHDFTQYRYVIIYYYCANMYRQSVMYPINIVTGSGKWGYDNLLSNDRCYCLKTSGASNSSIDVDVLIPASGIWLGGRFEMYGIK